MPINTFPSTINQYRFLTSDVLFLSCSRPLDWRFKAGQFVSIRMDNIHGTDPPYRWKSYSICSPPHFRDRLDFIIKIIPQGFASAAFLKLQVGSSLQIRGPFGHFTFDESSPAKEHWFLGAGTGITPLYSMISDQASKRSSEKFVLVFGARYAENLFFIDQIKDIQKRCPNFLFIPTLSRGDWSGAKGRVQSHLPDDLAGKDFYLCGLNELIVHTRSSLASRGVSPEMIHSERYD